MVVAAAIRETIEVPEGVEVIIENNEVSVKGPNGEDSRKFTYPNVNIKKDDDVVVLETAFPKKKDKAMIGTTRAHINNMIVGVTDGFTYHKDIVADDTLKREAIRRSGNFRVWSLSFKDVQNVFATQGDYATDTLEATKMPSGTRMYLSTVKKEQAEDLNPSKLSVLCVNIQNSIHTRI